MELTLINIGKMDFITVFVVNTTDERTSLKWYET